MSLNGEPTLYLFAGSNGAGKTTFARAYLRQLDPIPRFLNADEIARGLSPFDPQKFAVRAGKLLLREIHDCIESGISFGLESILSGNIHAKLLERGPNPSVIRSSFTTSGFPRPHSPSAASDNASRWAGTRFRRPMCAAGLLGAASI
jgi:hypothetical protein